MRIAIATRSLARIDSALEQACHLLIFEVTAEGYRHLRSSGFRRARHGETGLKARLESLKGCALLFLQTIDSEVETELARLKITPLLRFADQPVALALEALQTELRGAPPMWLRRIEQRDHLTQTGEPYEIERP
jgi:nitrogen fixation protein NifX